MKITDLHLNKFYGEFILHGTAREANLIRKYLMGRVPVYAIDLIRMKTNTSAYPIEYIAHRLGMIPIKVLDKNPKPEYEGVLAYKATNKKKELTTFDMVLPEGVEVALWYPDNVKNKNGYEIIDLLPGQEIDIIFVIRQGIGFKHAKFQTALASYEMLDENKYKVFFETNFQYTAEELLRLVKDYIKRDFKTLLNIY